MLDSLKQTGKNIGRGLGSTWESLSEGWRDLFRQSRDALTHFTHKAQAENRTGANYPHWGLLAGEVEETGKDIVVKIELPGMEKEDCRITIEDGVLYLRGEKHLVRESFDSTFHVMERAYGAFQRAIPLPGNVDVEQAEASYKNGVLLIRLPKVADPHRRTIAVE